MSKYTTGELARLCGVSVRTVQYYDQRNILVPSQLSEGGRRLYSDDDLNRMKIICFLRDMGISINSIAALFQEEHPEKVIDTLLEQQEQALRQDLTDCQSKLELLDGIRRQMKDIPNFSVESIGDIACIINSKKNMKKLHLAMLLIGIPLDILQVAGIVLWIVTGQWWLFALWLLAAIPGGIGISCYYFTRTAYICPECHTVFKPRFKDVFWANHTPTMRKLTCPCCKHKGFCVEICQKEEK